MTSVAPAEAGLRPTPWRQLFRSLHDPFVCAMFLSLLLIGGDRLALHVGGMTMRLVFPLLMTAFGFLYLQSRAEIQVPIGLSALFFLLAIAGAISTINSFVVSKSIGYTIWVFFNFYVIITLCYNFARRYPPEQVLSFWFMIFRIHVFLAFADTALNVARGNMERSFLWFYEPSYMAIFLTAYFGSSLYMFLRVGRPYALDFGMSMLSLLVTASATGMFGIAFALLLNLIVARQRLKLLLWSTALIAIFLGALVLFFSDTLYYRLVAGFLFNNGQVSMLDLILGRAGNRWIRVLVGWDAFQRHPWTGVGIGGDAAYMDAMPLPDSVTPYIRPWTDTSGQPFCNIFIEVLGTMGIIGFVPFISMLTYCGFQAVRLVRSSHPLAPIAMAFFMGFFCSILAMQLEGTMLRYYLWTPLGLAFGTLAQIRQEPIGRQNHAWSRRPAVA